MKIIALVPTTVSSPQLAAYLKHEYGHPLFQANIIGNQLRGRQGLVYLRYTAENHLGNPLFLAFEKQMTVVAEFNSSLWTFDGTVCTRVPQASNLMSAARAEAANARAKFTSLVEKAASNLDRDAALEAVLILRDNPWVATAFASAPA